MAYSATLPPFKLTTGGITGSARTVWGYESADASATVVAAGYITDGGDRGMKVNDLVICWDTATPQIFSCRVHSVSATAPGAVDLANATVIGIATNS
jgi:hypothetical protein